MKKIAVVFLLALGCLPARAADTQKPIRAEVFWEPLSPESWRNFFAVDSVQSRLPAGTLEIVHHVLVLKDKEGQWRSRKGGGELLESARMAAIAELYPDKLRDYLLARSMDTSLRGWQDAARFAGINPEQLDKAVRSGKEKRFNKNMLLALSDKVSKPAVLLDGKEYEGRVEPLGLLEKVNALLPEAKRVAVAPAMAVEIPKMWVVVGEPPFGDEQVRLTKALGRVLGADDASAEKVEYASAQYKKLFKKVHLKSLPAYLFKDEGETGDILAGAIGVPLEKTGGYLLFSEPSEGAYYPDKSRKARTLELFVMSQCPFGVMAEQTLAEALDGKLLPDGVKLQVHYIADARTVDGKLEFSSLHGQPEWEENARQMYIQKRHPGKFWDYLKARNADYRSPEWEAAAKKAGLDADELKKGFEEGKKLLAEDVKIAQSYGISASPTFVWEGRAVVSGIGGISRIKGFEKIKSGGKPAGSCN